MNYFLIIFSAVLAVAADIVAANYCGKGLCHPSKPHIGCNNPWAYTSSCSAGGQMLHSNDLNDYIVLMHNTYRNYAASGVWELDPACRMEAMQWDHELEFLAGLNLQTCRSEHDKCRNTLAYPNAGQNVAHKIANVGTQPTFVINGIILDWFMEGSQATLELMMKYGNINLPHREFPNFATMVIENNNRIGCAVSTEPISDTKINYLLTCNYAHAPVNMTYIYKFCQRPGQKCDPSKDPMFPYLCNEDVTYQYG